MMQLVKDMAFLVNHLMDERGAGSKHVEPQEDPRWFMEQWEQFRALVNTREPKPASPEFLKVQDRVLQLMVAEPGITEADELARTASDPRLSICRGTSRPCAATPSSTPRTARFWAAGFPGTCASTTPSTLSPACSCA